jgi:hypothetical protein
VSHIDWGAKAEDRTPRTRSAMECLILLPNPKTAGASDDEKAE